mgnify:CR=1 FL=1
MPGRVEGPGERLSHPLAVDPHAAHHRPAADQASLGLVRSLGVLEREAAAEQPAAGKAPRMMIAGTWPLASAASGSGCAAKNARLRAYVQSPNSKAMPSERQRRPRHVAIAAPTRGALAGEASYPTLWSCWPHSAALGRSIESAVEDMLEMAIWSIRGDLRGIVKLGQKGQTIGKYEGI